jgi:MFS family permease
MILPLALAQFIASYAATNMNVAISAIAEDLGTTVSGVQTAITLFTLTMAALMIPGSKLTDIWGRKRCFVLGLAVYAVGGLLAALAQGLPLLIAGCLGWLGPGRRQTARRQAICRGPHHDAGLRLDRPGHRRPHSPPASRGHTTTILSGGVCA